MSDGCIFLTVTIPAPTLPPDIQGPPAYYIRWMRAISGLTAAEAKELFEQVTGWDSYFPDNTSTALCKEHSDRAREAERNRNKTLERIRLAPIRVSFPKPFTKLEAYNIVHKYCSVVHFKFSTNCPSQSSVPLIGSMV